LVPRRQERLGSSLLVSGSAGAHLIGGAFARTGLRVDPIRLPLALLIGADEVSGREGTLA